MHVGQEGADGIRVFVILKQKIKKPSNKISYILATLTHLQIKISSKFISVWFTCNKMGYVMGLGYQIWLLSSNWWKRKYSEYKNNRQIYIFFFFSSFLFQGTTLCIQAKKSLLWCIKFIGSSNCFYCIMQDGKLVLLYSKSIYNVFKVLF